MEPREYHLPRTPNGAADLLSGDPPTEDDGDVECVVPPPSHLFADNVFVDHDDEEEEEEDVKAVGGDLYDELNTFGAQLENELQSLEQYGVSKQRGQRLDPDGKDECNESRVSRVKRKANKAPKLKKGNGESTRRLEVLTGKTSQIMTDYQSYLADISNEFPLSDDDEDDDADDDERNNATMAIVQDMKDDIIFSYVDHQMSVIEEGGSIPSSSLLREWEPPIAERDNNYAAGGGEPLYRAFERNESAGYDLTSVFGEQVKPSMQDFGSTGSNSRGRGRGCGRCCTSGGGNGTRYAHPWMHSRRVKRGMAMLMLTVAAAIGISLTISVVHRENLPDLEEEYLEEEMREIEKEERDEVEFMESEEMNHNAKEGLTSIQHFHPDEVSATSSHKQLDTHSFHYGKAVDGGSREDIHDLNGGHLNEEEKEKTKGIANESLKEAGLTERDEEYTVTQKVLGQVPNNSSGEASIIPVHVKLDPYSVHHVEAANSESIDDLPDLEKEMKDIEAEGHEGLKNEDDDNHSVSQKLINPLQNPPHGVMTDESKKDLPNFEEETLHKMKSGLDDEMKMDHIKGDVATNVYYEAALKYKPAMFNRSQGWVGRTYIESLLFCEESAGLAICPYTAVCPDGVDSEPLGGYRETLEGFDYTWIPILDGRNEWVQVGKKHAKCVRYKDMYGETPSWGLSGENNDPITQNVMCCLNV